MTAKQVICTASARRARARARRVPRPRRRADHRHRPAEGLRYTLVQLRDRVEALLPKASRSGARATCTTSASRPSSRRSRPPEGPLDHRLAPRPGAHPPALRPRGAEIADGLVEITTSPASPATAPRSPSSRTPTASTRSVPASARAVSRVRMVVSELRGEKIDIIPFNDEPARFVAKALSPARARGARRRREPPGHRHRPRRPARTRDRPRGPERPPRRPPHRLAHRHPLGDRVRRGGGRQHRGGAGEEHTGMCAAILGNGRRCPNDSLPGLRYCGLKAHQALARVSTDLVAALAPLSIEEVEALADPLVQDDEVADAIAAVEAEAEDLVAQAEADAAEAEEAELGDPDDAEEALEEFTADEGRCRRRGAGARRARRGGSRGGRRRRHRGRPRRGGGGAVAAPHTPFRRCAGCGRRAPQGAMLRIGSVDGIAQMTRPGSCPAEAHMHAGDRAWNASRTVACCPAHSAHPSPHRRWRTRVAPGACRALD